MGRAMKSKGKGGKDAGPYAKSNGKSTGPKKDSNIRKFRPYERIKPQPGKKTKSVLADVSMDDFLKSGLENTLAGSEDGEESVEGEIEEEEEEEEDDEDDDISELEFESDMEDEEARHIKALENLAQRDPKFHQFLQENEANLLEFKPDQEPEGLESRLAAAMGQKELTVSLVMHWQKDLVDTHSIATLEKVLSALQSATNLSEDTEYKFNDPEGWARLLELAAKLLTIDSIQQSIGDGLQPYKPRSQASYSCRDCTKWKSVSVYTILALLMMSETW